MVRDKVDATQRFKMREMGRGPLVKVEEGKRVLVWGLRLSCLQVGG
jgi:hypothetical protein